MSTDPFQIVTITIEPAARHVTCMTVGAQVNLPVASEVLHCPLKVGSSVDYLLVFSQIVHMGTANPGVQALDIDIRSHPVMSGREYAAIHVQGLKHPFLVSSYPSYLLLCP